MAARTMLLVAAVLAAGGGGCAPSYKYVLTWDSYDGLKPNQTPRYFLDGKLLGSGAEGLRRVAAIRPEQGEAVRLVYPWQYAPCGPNRGPPRELVLLLREWMKTGIIVEVDLNLSEEEILPSQRPVQGSDAGGR